MAKPDMTWYCRTRLVSLANLSYFFGLSKYVKIEFNQIQNLPISKDCLNLVYGTNLQKFLGIDHVRSNIINQSKFLILVQDIPEENAALGKIVLVRRIETSDIRSDGKFAFQKLFAISWSRKWIGEIIRSAFLVHSYGLRSVSLIIHGSGSVGTIDGNLVEIRTQTMTMSVVVRK